MSNQSKASRLQAAFALCVVSLANTAFAQTSFPGTLKQLKAETIRRTEIGQYPMVGYTVADIRDALSGVKSKADDDWAAGFML